MRHQAWRAAPSAAGPVRGHRVPFPMNKLCIFGATLILGYVGWALGELLGFSFFGCFFVSSVGTIAGVFVGWKIAQKLG